MIKPYNDFATAVRELATVLRHDLERSLRPQAIAGEPGALFCFPSGLKKILLIGDLHPSDDNHENLSRLIARFIPSLERGELGVAILGDFTHPHGDGVTVMEPSLRLFMSWLAPLKISYPRQVVLVRGDHESVGAPYGLDFGKTGMEISRMLDRDSLLSLCNNGALWLLAPNRAVGSSKEHDHPGIFDSSPSGMRFSFKGKRLLSTGFSGSWFDFQRLESSDDRLFLCFSNPEAGVEQRLRVETAAGSTRFFWLDPAIGREYPCSIVVNQSQLFGQEVAAIGGDELRRRLQSEVYDRLPLMVKGKCFAANHGIPPIFRRGGDREENEITLPEILGLTVKNERPVTMTPWFQTIFGRPFMNSQPAFDQAALARFMQTLGLPAGSIYVTAHTTIPDFATSAADHEDWPFILTGGSLVTVFSVAPHYLILDSQGTSPMGILVENKAIRAPNRKRHFWKVVGPE